MNTSRISKITVSRLYNLGNYEHIRYELTVDVPADTSATSAIVAVERILTGMKPLDRLPVQTAQHLAHEGERINRMKSLDDEGWSREYGHCVGTREEVIQRYEKSLAEETEKRWKAVNRAKLARDLFDSLGGAEQFKDAKLDWEDNDF